MPTRTITVRVYKTKDGAPTCCILAGSRECEFLGFRHLGTQPVCMLGEQVDLERDGDGTGFIVPHDGCRLHYVSPVAGANRLVCPKCGNNRQVWTNQVTGRLTCHRAGCHAELERH